MRLLKKSTVKNPKVSLILLDWNVRDSFHICYYLRNQTIPQDQFEVIVVEYYSTVTSAIKTFQDNIDTLALLEMPKSSYYHKHLMYNVGFLLSHGELIVICDSDAMAKPTFIQSIIESFEQQPNIVLHLDQFRNQRRDLYPFQYPTFEEITDHGCINYQNGVTSGIAEKTDRLHRRNYGACFCCRRKDYLAIGGSDEHVDFVGHICGPYDLTFRLMNLGKTERWHDKEFLYHTWHPGSDGIGEYLGPHDGYNLSTTSLEALWSRRTEPHVPHPLILKLKEGQAVTEEEITAAAINNKHLHMTNLTLLKSEPDLKKHAQKTYRDFKPENLPNHFSKWKKFRFISVVLLQKIYSFFMGRLPIWWKMISKIFKQTKQQWQTLNCGTAYHLSWWETISHLHPQKKPNYVVVNTPRDLCVLSEFIRWRSKLSLRSRHHIQLLFLGDIDKKKIQEIQEKGQEGNLYITQTASFDWNQSADLKDLKVSLI